MNILFISHDSSRTGAPLALLSLLKSVKAKMPDVTFSVFCKADGPLVNEFKQLCPVILPTGKPWVLPTLFTPSNLRERLSIRLLLQHIKRQHFDLIYANSASSLSCAVILKERLHIPVLLHFHESSINSCYIEIHKRWIRQCDHFIAVSPLSRDGLVELGAEPSKINIVYPTSDFIIKLLAAPQTSDMQTAKDSAKTIIGFVGPLIERKGADLLAVVMRRLSTLHPDCDYEIRSVGNYLDMERKRVEFDIQRLDVKDRIRFLAPMEDPVPAYKEMDMLLVLSREESFSLIVPEFGLLGKPVVLFNGSCGVQHFLKHEENALIASYLDIDGIVEAIYQLSKDANERHRLGENLRKTITEHYSQYDTNSQIINLLKEIKPSSSIS